MHLWEGLQESPPSNLNQDWGWLTVPSAKAPNPVTPSGNLFQMHVLSTDHGGSTYSGKYRKEETLAHGKCSLALLFA